MLRVCSYLRWRLVRKEWLKVTVDSNQRRYLANCTVLANEGNPQHNVGIIAHIDAGKTTTTEHMLYTAGVTSRAGSVDSGNTVMDFLPLERERGITISSSVISFNWRDHILNIIDTPGHVDFTFEVERTLPILDGTVTILDASSGVQAQTLAVWRQAKHYKLPCISFVNKMDSPTANLYETIESMRDKLSIKPLLLQLPLGTGRDFHGVIDLVQCNAFISSHSSKNVVIPLSDLSHDIQCKVRYYRDQLIEQVAMIDDHLAILLLEDDKTIQPNDLEESIRRICMSCEGVPILCGSALRGIAIKQLLDAIIKYLPTTSKLKIKIPTVADKLCAYSFKQVYDTHRGILVYLRILSGSLKTHTTLYNATRHSKEKVTRLLSAQADRLHEVKEIYSGNIAVAVGLKNTMTGDILVQSEKVGRSVGVASLLTPPTIPPPVFFCTVEPSSVANQKNLEHALQCLTREDPSLHVTFDPDTGQTILSGMGELHLEIAHERLKTVYGVKCDIGQLHVAYRETISHDATATLEHPNIVTTVTLIPNECDENKVIFDSNIEFFNDGEKDVVITAVTNSLMRGPLLGYPIHNVCVHINKLSKNEGTPVAIICNCVTQAVMKAMIEGDIKILEPVTDLTITVCEDHVGLVLSDLTSVRRALIQSVKETENKGTIIIAKVPLATLLGYASKLRSLTSGTASLTMSLSGYSPVDSHHQDRLVEELTKGY